jgi:hypothetical protein
MEAVKQPDAREIVAGKIDETFAQWRSLIASRQRTQQRLNIATDFDVGARALAKRRAFADETALSNHIVEADAHYDGGFLSGALETEDQAHSLKLAARRSHIGNFILDTGDEELIGNPNELIAELNEHNKARAGAAAEEGAELVVPEIEPGLFGPDDIAELGKIHAARKSAAEAKAKEQLEIAQGRQRQAVLDMILAGTATDDDGKEIDPIDFINDMDALEASEKWTWIERHNARAKTVLEGPEPTPAAIVRAENEIYEAKEADDFDRAYELLIKHSPMFTAAKNSEILKAIRKQQTEDADDILADGLAKIDRLRAVHVGAAKAEKKSLSDIESIEDRYLRDRNKLRRKFAANPDWTDEQKIAYIDTLNDAEVKEAAPGLLRRIGAVIRAAGTYYPMSPLFDRRGGKKKDQSPEYTKTATNPKTGEKVGWDGTKWVKIK